ncbi:uncharacterized protein LOC130070670 [Rhinichthys klamathensis goyatoka]|uniref:uncharacterized protein LOC130070670 n=1 Tax=Rhinichthys klamathensis goyatoka TaxID=3034132 RepID=UPI0024B535F7|nr:uncharacterized protein LOC130070670 [Rhinichthys klamathensis goyatoka]
MTIATLRSRLSDHARVRAPSSTPRSSASMRGSTSAGGQDDLRVTVWNKEPAVCPCPTAPSSVLQPASVQGIAAGPFPGAPRVSFGAPEEDAMSIAASQNGSDSSESDDSSQLPPSGVNTAVAQSDPEMTAMLSRAPACIRLEWTPPPCPERSRLDDWFLGAAAGSRLQPAPIPFFPDVHDEVSKPWKTPMSSCDRSLISSAFPPLDGAAARGYTGLPSVECSVAIQLCPQSASSRGEPKHPSKACRFLSMLVAKSYRAAEQAAASLHAMATLQVYKAQMLRDMHEGIPIRPCLAA